MCVCVCVCVCVRACVRVHTNAMHACVCVLDGEGSRVIASIAVVVVWTAMYLVTTTI